MFTAAEDQKDMCDNQQIHGRPVCRLFAAGQCKRGRFCRFLHVVTIARDDPQQANASGSTVDSPPKRDKVMTESPKDVPQRPICRHLFNKGWCKFGSRCSFSHDFLRPSEAEQSRDIVDDGFTDDQTTGSEPNQTSERDIPKKEAEESKSVETQSKVCRFFKAGYCRMGWRCHYKHPQPQYRQHRFTGRPASRKAVEGYGPPSAAYAGRDDLKSIHSETSSDSGMIDDVAPMSKRGVVTEVISEVEEGKSSVTRDKTAEETLQDMRSTEIRQLKKRFPRAEEVLSSSGGTRIQFVFAPTDPDWPYDVKEMNLQVDFPAEYPSKMMKIVMLEDERVPESVRRLMTEGIDKWITSRFEYMNSMGKTDLPFRPFLRWFDRKSEQLLTEALKEYRRERMAEIAGLQFISADQLKTRYKVCDQEEQDDEQSELTERKEAGKFWKETNSAAVGENSEVKEEDEAEEEEEEKESVLNEDNSTKGDQSSQSSGLTARRGTEISLQNLQLLNCAATLLAVNVSLMISCSRCSNKGELKANAGQLNRAECPYCRNQQLVMFRPSMAHQLSCVIGYLDLDGCDAFDMILSDCLFLVNCLECSFDNKLQALPPGQLNTTWCLHCHNKLTVAANNVRFVNLGAASAIDTKKVCTVEIKRRVKAVKDPAIVEGQPLPDNGTCKHFRKSYRWFRFPCCGKAYPCDHCHDEKEKDHEMLLANRMICGFCAREQSYSSDRPCIGCNANITNKATAHWEGGTGCRDKVKMSRGDSKKYCDSLKTTSRSQGKKDPAKKVTKLRHL